MSCIVNDKRTDEDRKATMGFVVAIDSFMSSWGEAKRRSIFAVPFRDFEQAARIETWLHDRSEMKRVRVVRFNWWPRLRNNDHLTVCAMDDFEN